MLYYTVDPRDGIVGASGTECLTCCCERMDLKPGETQLVTINYAPWSVPIGGYGIVPTPQIEVYVDTGSCNTNAIDGFAPPAVTIPTQTVAVNGTLSHTIAPTPATNTFTFKRVPLEGPYNGSHTLDPSTGAITYTPNNSFEGWDVIFIEITDAQNRSIIKPLVIQVGSPVGAVPTHWIQTKPYVDMSKVFVDQRSQHLRFPIHMPVVAQPCEIYRLMIKQPAKDCDLNTFTHFVCFDIRHTKC